MSERMRDWVATAELAARLGPVDLRVFDCTSYLEPTPPGSDARASISLCRGSRRLRRRIFPARDFLDLQGEFSDQSADLRFMMPATARAARRRRSVPTASVANTNVALYSIGTMMWATRFWWMLTSLGFDNVSVLDGGFDRWTAEGRPIEKRGPARGYPSATFAASPRAGYFVDRHAVRAAMAQSMHRRSSTRWGRSSTAERAPSRYGRPGRIPGSVNVPAASLIDPQTKDVRSARGREGKKFAAQGITAQTNVVAYCGGGISGHYRSVPAAPVGPRQARAL